VNPHSVLVVGAGWSGLACALALADAGLRPCLVDASTHPGGRARRVSYRLGDRRYNLDNGQHILLGAYRDTLNLMRSVGMDTDAVLDRTPFRLTYPDGWQLQAGHGRAPWHLASGLLTARHLPWRDRLALVRWQIKQQGQGWQWPGDGDPSATELLRGLPASLIERLLRPLCLAALNTEPSEASGRLFLRVLADSLGGSSTASHLLVPRTDLSALFAQPALDQVCQRGGTWMARTTVRTLDHDGRTWRVVTSGQPLCATRVVLALPVEPCRRLLESAAPAVRHALEPTTLSRLDAIRHAPISTVYLRYAPTVRLTLSHYALLDDPAAKRPAQWVFDRGAFHPADAGVLAAVISGHGPHEALDEHTLCAQVAQQLSSDLGLPAPIDAVRFADKRATILATPGLQRPAVRQGPLGLYLAGDTADSPYPSTLEGSVRAGLDAARALLTDIQSASQLR
jgi:squalene-associated FAD-dependent desaturase